MGGGIPYEDGSRWFRFHQKGVHTCLRAPFGCEVIFKQAPTKAKEFQPVKFEGTGSTGTLAGYRFQPGYKWNGVYLVWSLDELLAVDLSAGAKSFPEASVILMLPRFASCPPTERFAFL